jgi:hypothetical protein
VLAVEIPERDLGERVLILFSVLAVYDTNNYLILLLSQMQAGKSAAL